MLLRVLGEVSGVRCSFMFQKELVGLVVSFHFFVLWRYLSVLRRESGQSFGMKYIPTRVIRVTWKRMKDGSKEVQYEDIVREMNCGTG